MIVIIQARIGSKRLKNKVLTNINQKPLIWYVINQVKKSKNVKKIVIAIPKKNSDNKLYQYLKDNYNVYRGDEVNVAKRMMFAAKNITQNFLLEFLQIVL